MGRVSTLINGRLLGYSPGMPLTFLRGIFAALRLSRILPTALLSVAIGLAHLTAVATAADLPRPPELERDVQFWIRVYTQVTTHEGLLHDERNLAVVYQTLQFEPDIAPSERREQIDAQREHYRAILRLQQGGRCRPVAVHALYRPALSAHRRCRR